jgi:hypothetical protein
MCQRARWYARSDGRRVDSEVPLASVSERVSEGTWSDGMTVPIDEIASFECNIAGVRNCPYLSESRDRRNATCKAILHADRWSGSSGTVRRLVLTCGSAALCWIQSIPPPVTTISRQPLQSYAATRYNTMSPLD